jgi:hypothetical protein
MWKGGILLADPKSAKCVYGHDHPEYLDSKDKDFLREGHTTFPHSQLVFQLTPPSKEGMVVVEAQQFSGWYSQMGVSQKKVIWH